MDSPDTPNKLFSVEDWNILLRNCEKQTDSIIEVTEQIKSYNQEWQKNASLSSRNELITSLKQGLDMINSILYYQNKDPTNYILLKENDINDGKQTLFHIKNKLASIGLNYNF